MSGQEFSEDALESLAREELSDSELRDLMERLAASEFGVPERSTIGDVCELTETSPVVVGRILADIRQTSFEELYLSHVQSLDRRVDAHEEELKRHKARLEDLDRRQRMERSRSRQAVSRREVSEPVQGHKSAGVVVFLAVMFVWIVVAVLFGLREPVEPEIVSRMTFGGKEYEMSKGGQAYIRENGVLKEASDRNSALAEMYWRNSRNRD